MDASQFLSNLPELLDPRLVLPVYSMLLLGAVWLVSSSLLSRFRLKDQVELEHKEALRLKQLDQVKSDFFTNVTHELRTPLTLIQGHLEHLGQQITDPALHDQVRIAQRSAKQLEKLVDQLLDTSRLEADRMNLDLRHGDIVAKLLETAQPFVSLAEQRKISFSINTGTEGIMADFDPDKLEIIVSNVLSNAFKYTDSGSVSLVVGLTRMDGRNHVRVAVSDTGIGIPTNEIPRIFDRYYQGSASSERRTAGTGIGLSLVKQFVDLHRGDITLLSELGQGTEVTVLLPLVQIIQQNGNPIQLPAWQPESATAGLDLSTANTHTDDAAPLVLVVEDNAEITDFLRLMLAPAYKVITAPGGTTGLDLAMSQLPDLIISDVMMPDMDGLQLTSALKGDERTSHIPVILLTAKVGLDNRLQGLGNGADGYLTKPFSSQELLLKVSNLIASRRKLRTKYARSVLTDTVEVSENSVDERFLKRVRDSIQRHLDDEHFEMEQLASEVGMSRAQLHRKLTALTDRSATRFVRAYRMEHAHAMLKANVGNVSEIAFRVGYSNSAYFTRCFTEDFGYPPSKVRDHSQ